jgi:hypothetical protein
MSSSFVRLSRAARLSTEEGAAVDLENLAGYERCLRRREVSHRGGDILRPSRPSHQGLGDQAFPSLGRHRVREELGVLDVAGSDDVRRDAGRTQRGGQLVRPADERRLRRRVGVAAAAKRGDRTVVASARSTPPALFTMTSTSPISSATVSTWAGTERSASCHETASLPAPRSAWPRCRRARPHAGRG